MMLVLCFSLTCDILQWVLSALMSLFILIFLKIISYGSLSSSTNQNSQLESCRSYFSAICRGCNMFEVNGKNCNVGGK